MTIDKEYVKEVLNQYADVAMAVSAVKQEIINDTVIKHTNVSFALISVLLYRIPRECQRFSVIRAAPKLRWRPKNRLASGGCRPRHKQ